MWQGVMVDITEQQGVPRTSLRATEERYRALVEHIPAVVYAEGIDARGAEDCSTSVRRWRRSSATRPRSGVDGLDFWWQHIHPDDLDRVRAVNARANETRRDLPRRVPIPRRRRSLPTGSTTRPSVVLDDDGLAAVLAGRAGRHHPAEAGRAGSARRRTRATGRWSNTSRRSSTPRSPDADPEKFYISPQVADLFGYTAEEWTWTPDFWIDRIHPDDQAMVLDADERCQPDARAVPTATTGSAIAMDAGSGCATKRRSCPRLTARGTGRASCWTSPQRKEAEEQLREAELKFRTIVEQNQAIFYTQEIDPDDPAISRTTYIAPGNTEMLGYTLEDVQADPTLWRKIVHPDDRERVFAADAESNLGGDDDASRWSTG